MVSCFLSLVVRPSLFGGLLLVATSSYCGLIVLTFGGMEVFFALHDVGLFFTVFGLFRDCGGIGLSLLNGSSFSKIGYFFGFGCVGACPLLFFAA